MRHEGVLFVIDPLADLQAEVDSSVGLMLATQELGVEVWVCGPEELAVVGGRLAAPAQPAPAWRAARPATTGGSSSPSGGTSWSARPSMSPTR